MGAPTGGGEAALALTGLLAVAAKVAADAGGPRWIFTLAQLAAVGLAVGLLAILGRTRWLDAPRAVLVALALLMLPTVYGEVGGDGLQAFVVVRSSLLDGDLELENDYRGLGARPVGGEAGEATSHLPAGLALMWMAPFAAAHLGVTLASVLGAATTADGFSIPYRSAVTAGSYLYGVFALLLIETELRRRHGRALALLGVLGVWLATPLHFYMTANPAMAHASSVGAATAFVVGWLRVREAPTLRRWLVVGLLGGLMTLVRLQDAVLLVLPLADLALRRPSRPLAAAGSFLGGAGVLGLLQLAMWLRLYGAGFLGTILRVNLVGGEGGGPHLIELLLSARHGLLTWTPLYVVCIAGWLLWLRRETALTALLLSGFLLSLLVNASMQDWWGAESFGQRRLLGLTPLFALGLGQALAFLRARPLAALGAGLAALVAWNLPFEEIYNSERLVRRDQAISLEQLAPAQVDWAWRRLLALHGRVPPPLWVLAYENLKGVWLDEGPRSLRGQIDVGNEPPDLPVLIGRGFYPPESEAGVSFRRSRGRGSWLRVPIRTPADYRAVLRVRPEIPEPVRLIFEVNRQPVGTADLAPGWAEYVFAIPAACLRPGLNDIGLAYSVTPREVRPGEAGRNAAVAVDRLSLEPTAPGPGGRVDQRPSR